MLRAFACVDHQPCRLVEDATAEILSQAVWIDLLSPTPEEIARVQSATGLVLPDEPALSEIETSSRLATRDGVLYLSTPLVSMIDGPHGVSAGFILSPDRLITIRFSVSRIFDLFSEQFPRAEPRPRPSADILIGLLEAIVDRQADALEQVRADLDAISRRIFSMGAAANAQRKQEDALLRKTLTTLGHIGDLISHVRETQVGVARIVPYVEGMTAEWLPKEMYPRLETLRHDIASVSDYNTHLNDKLQFMLDATLGFINIAQNSVMKVMTIASVAGIPPVLVAGIYGMNFKVMPELDWPWGYAYGLAMIVVTTIIPLLIFRWRRWI